MTITELIRKIFVKEKLNKQISNESELYNFIINHPFVRTVIGSMEENPFDNYCVTRVYFKKNEISSDLCVWLRSHPKSPVSYECILDWGTYTTFNGNISEQTYLRILSYLKSVSYNSMNTLEDTIYLKNKYLK